MPRKQPGDGLSRRERQIMDVLYQVGEASVAEVQKALPDPPSYSAVRATLRIMEEKGHVRHKSVGPRYLYLPAQPVGRARRSALRKVVETFFDGSSEQAFAALLDMKGSKKDELERMEEMIRKAREEGR